MEKDYKKLYEEEHKKYEGALERARGHHSVALHYSIANEIQELEHIFPELKEKENEGDRIRRAIINVFATHKGFEVFYGATVNDILSWLKKQGEPKPAEVRTPGYWNVQDIEPEVKQIEEDISAEPGGIYSTVQKQADTPKFKVGDWCIESKYNTVFQITKVSRDTYTCRSNVGETYSCMHYSLEEVARLWTIQDAEDGDVLATDNCLPFIYDKDRYNNGLAYYYAGLDVNRELTLKSPHHMLAHFGSLRDVVPATREQRDLLFSKMKEAGYEWDAEKKEVKKIEQKTDWSEEDEKHIMAIDLAVNRCRGKWNCCGETCPISEHRDWLKSIKEQMKGE